MFPSIETRFTASTVAVQSFLAAGSPILVASQVLERSENNPTCSNNLRWKVKGQQWIKTLKIEEHNTRLATLYLSPLLVPCRKKRKGQIIHEQGN